MTKQTTIVVIGALRVKTAIPVNTADYDIYIYCSVEAVQLVCLPSSKSSTLKGKDLLKGTFFFL